LKFRRKKIVFLLIVAIVLIAVVGFLFFQNKHQDEVLERVFANAANIDFYTQEVRTETALSGRHIVVEGVYHNDIKNAAFSSISTTTVRVPDVSFPIAFTLYNVSINGNVYTKAESENPELITTVQVGGGWRQFSAREIPQEYKSIAIAGPVLDNLSLISNNGTHLSLKKTAPNDETFGAPLLRYSFTVRSSLKDHSGALSAIYERLKETGTADIWVSEETAEVRHMVFKNPPYFSTTTISNIGTPQVIDTPVL
jgi:hypothetical protein